MPALIDTVDSVRFANGRLKVQASGEFHRRFLTADFFAEYDPAPEGIPEQIAPIPFVANVAPIAFLSGEEWTVPLLDATFAAAIEDLRTELSGEHPDLEFSGSIVALDTIESAIDRSPAPHTHVALFSGGLDSIHAALAHRTARLCLLTVHGADIALYDEAQWGHVRAAAESFGQEWRFFNAFVRSNLRTFIDVPRLEASHGIAEWWQGLQHGVALIGLTAPILPLSPEAHVVIASTGGDWFRATSGSTRHVDETIHWGPTVTVHHGYNLTRAQKAAEVAAWTRDDGHKLPRLRVCFQSYALEGRNCARCEKCLRTATAVLLTGGVADQIREGLTADAMVKRIIRGVRWHRLRIGTTHRDHWGELARTAETLLDSGASLDPEVERLARWLVGVDFDRYERRRRPLTRLESATVRILRRTEGIERLVKAARGMLRRARR